MRGTLAGWFGLHKIECALAKRCRVFIFKFMKTLTLLFVAAALTIGPVAHAQDVGTAGLNPQTAQALRSVLHVANKHFSRMPQVQLTSRIENLCEGGVRASKQVRYCTSLNVIYIAADLSKKMPREAAAYVLAHEFGHAVQVRHGIADVALAKIQSDRAREPELRAMVTKQVECIAGVLFGRAHPKSRAVPSTWFSGEMFSDRHWGRVPLSSGPEVSIGAAARDQWFATGRKSRDFASCTVGEMSAGLILRAER